MDFSHWIAAQPVEYLNYLHTAYKIQQNVNRRDYADMHEKLDEFLASLSASDKIAIELYRGNRYQIRVVSRTDKISKREINDLERKLEGNNANIRSKRNSEANTRKPRKKPSEGGGYY